MLLVITMLSLAVAVAASTVAWRIAREERRRSDARVAALAGALFTDESPAPVAVNELFTPAARPRTQGSFVNALAIGVLIVGTTLSAALMLGGSPEGSAAAASDDDAVDLRASELAAAPLELTALSHERDRDELSVRGLVRNASPDTRGGAVTAAISVFNRDGELVATGRGPVEGSALEAGVESRFVVRIPGVAGVHRYRVSFSVDDRPVAHIDRRGQTVTAQLP